MIIAHNDSRQLMGNEGVIQEKEPRNNVYALFSEVSFGSQKKMPENTNSLVDKKRAALAATAGKKRVGKRDRYTKG